MTENIVRSSVKIRLFIGILLVLLLPGCFPITSSYLRLEAPDARYFRNSCHGGYGPSSVIYYPYHGAFISLDISPWIRLGLHLPAGTTAQLNGNTVRIEGQTEAGPVVFTAKIEAARRGSLGTIDPPELLAFPDPFTSATDFGPFNGASKDGHHIWHLFIAFDNQIPRRVVSAPHGLISGTIELPSITVNGQRFEPQQLQFKREIYGELSPINC